MFKLVLKIPKVKYLTQKLRSKFCTYEHNKRPQKQWKVRGRGPQRQGGSTLRGTFPRLFQTTEPLIERQPALNPDSFT